jgi:hypothetical protein
MVIKLFNTSKNNPENKTVLFVCVENSARSQMAEGFFRNILQKTMQHQVLELDHQEKGLIH